MAHSSETRNAVRSAYVYDRHPLDVAADKNKVSYNTVRGWKKRDKAKGDDWDKARTASQMAAGGLGDVTAQLVEDFVRLFQSTVEDITTGDYDGLKKAEALSRISDAYTKTMKAAAMGNPKIAKLSVALETLKLLAEHIKKDHPDLLERFINILEPFSAKVNEAFA